MVAFLGALASLYFASPWTALRGEFSQGYELFTGMLVYDSLTIYMRGILLLFAVMFIVFTRLSGIPDKEDGADIYSLVLGATLGMCLMASANHLLMVFMALEMASVPSYVLAGLMKGRRVGSEAALKYSVYGAGAAGVMLYGISLVAGVLNTVHLPTMATVLGSRIAAGLPGEEQMVLALGGLMIGVGLAFKLSAVPFHFWCPDVFEGATAEVNAFLSVASKAAALALLLRVVLGFGTLAPDRLSPGVALPAAPAQVDTAWEADELHRFVSVMHHPGHDELTPELAPAASDLGPVRSFAGKLIAFIAVITCTFGNLAAYGQTNIKRLLAYSTIAHAGYMMMAVPAVLAMAESNPSGAEHAVAGLALYIFVYVFMNLGAFVIVAFLRNAIRSEQIADYAGLIRRSPGIVICLSLILFSLVGLPPLAGFLGKFAIFASLLEGWQTTGQGYLMALLVVGGLNTAISLFYYLRVVKVMAMDPEPEERTPFEFPDVSLQGAYVWLLTLPTILLMLNWNGINELCRQAATQLLRG